MNEKSPSAAEALRGKDLSFHVLKQNGEFVKERAGLLYNFLSKPTLTIEEIEAAQAELNVLGSFINTSFPRNDDEIYGRDYSTRKSDEVSLYTQEKLHRNLLDPLLFMIHEKDPRFGGTRMGGVPVIVEDPDSILRRVGEEVRKRLK